MTIPHALMILFLSAATFAAWHGELLLLAVYLMLAMAVDVATEAYRNRKEARDEVSTLARRS